MINNLLEGQKRPFLIDYQISHSKCPNCGSALIPWGKGNKDYWEPGCDCYPKEVKNKVN